MSHRGEKVAILGLGSFYQLGEAVAARLKEEKGTVSYTHLDVYKRQIHHGLPLQAVVSIYFCQAVLAICIE